MWNSNLSPDGYDLQVAVPNMTALYFFSVPEKSISALLRIRYKTLLVSYLRCFGHQHNSRWSQRTLRMSTRFRDIFAHLGLGWLL